MIVFLIPKAARPSKTVPAIRCIPLSTMIVEASKGNKEADCYKLLAKPLFSSSSLPTEAGFPYLVKWALNRKSWTQYSLCRDLRSSGLERDIALLKKQGVTISNGDSQVVASFFTQAKQLKVLASSWAKGPLVTFTLVEGCQVEYDCVSTALKILHNAGGKVEKRGSQTERNFLIAACLPASEVKLFVVESEDLEVAMDGTGTITRDFFLRLRNQWALANPQITVEQAILDIRTLNFRAWIPGYGQLKIMAIVTDQVLPNGADIYAHRKNFKDKEVCVQGDVAFFGFDPQGSKPSAYTNKQCLRNFGWFFGLKDRVWSWFISNLKAGIAEIKKGKTVEESKLELQLLKSEKRIEDSFSTGERIRSIDWNTSGGSQAELPALFQGSVKDWLQRMTTADMAEQEIWVEIPGSYFSQIVCLEAVRYVAPELYAKGIPHGKVVYLKSHKIFVVSTEYWIENLINWGGCDQDDKFALVFRKHKDSGKIFVLIYRTPNDRNEYAIATADEDNLPGLKGDWQSEPCRFPTTRPLQASKSNEEIIKLGGKVENEAPRLRTFEDFLGKLDVMANPGWAVNIIACWNTGYDTRCPLPPMEACIDLSVQTCDSNQIEWLENRCLKLAKKMYNGVMNKTIKLDRKLAMSVFHVAGEYDEGFKVLLKLNHKTLSSLLYESDYSLLCQAASERIQKELDWFETVADELSVNAWTVSLPKLKKIAARIRKDFGDSLYEIMVDRVNLTFARWASCYKGPDVELFRWIPRGEEQSKLSPMGFDIVARKQKALLLTQRKYIWSRFPKNYSREAFEKVLAFVALYQLFSQANADHATPIKNLDLHKGLEKGSLISHKWLFETFCKVRKQM
jgi:hypothetical protein